MNVFFFRSNFGREPVSNWLKSLNKSDKKSIGEDIKTVQFGWPIGMPLVDHLGERLWEVRIRLRLQWIVHVLFFMDDKAMILVHGFIKKHSKHLGKNLS